MFSYKCEHEFKVRKTLSSNILNLYRDRVPVIVEAKNKNILEKNKFLCPRDLKMFTILKQIRDNCNVPHEKGLYYFINGNTSINLIYTLDYYYTKYKDQDGFLYIYIYDESTFG